MVNAFRIILMVTANAMSGSREVEMIAPIYSVLMVVQGVGNAMMASVFVTKIAMGLIVQSMSFPHYMLHS